MTKPRFKLNQKVYYSTKDCYGKIKKVLNIGDPEDIFLQGYRYIVELEGLWPDWSVADDYLESANRQSSGVNSSMISRGRNLKIPQVQLGWK